MFFLDNGARVRFIDYGHCDFVPLSHLRCILNSLPADRAHAIGPLSLVPPEAEENPDALAKLQAIVEDQTQFTLGRVREEKWENGSMGREVGLGDLLIELRPV